jgi:hypothetical protein
MSFQPELNRRYKLSFQHSSSGQIVTAQYNFKPESIDSTARGAIEIDDQGGARASFTGSVGLPSSSTDVVAMAPKSLKSFRGAVASDNTEFILGVDAQGDFVAKRVSTSILSLLHERGAEFQGKSVAKRRKLPSQTKPKKTKPAPKISASASLATDVSIPTL